MPGPQRREAGTPAPGCGSGRGSPFLNATGEPGTSKGGMPSDHTKRRKKVSRKRVGEEKGNRLTLWSNEKKKKTYEIFRTNLLSRDQKGWDNIMAH